jgi:hypothetical protein
MGCAGRGLGMAGNGLAMGWAGRGQAMGWVEQRKTGLDMGCACAKLRWAGLIIGLSRLGWA